VTTDVNQLLTEGEPAAVHYELILSQADHQLRTTVVVNMTMPAHLHISNCQLVKNQQ